MSEAILFHINAAGIAQLQLNRPERRNAFDDAMIEAMLAALYEVDVALTGSSQPCRVLWLSAAGQDFSAGADLGWMQRMVELSEAENIADAGRLGLLLRRLDQCPLPTLVSVQGRAFGGALGLIACCDIALASNDAQFCFSEVKLGLIPALISPYIQRAIGMRQARRYMLSAETFSARQAEQLQLVHQCCGDSQGLALETERMLTVLLKTAPQASRAAKRLLLDSRESRLDDELIDETVRRIAQIRTSAEGQEGLRAFLHNRPPRWLQDTYTHQRSHQPSNQHAADRQRGNNKPRRG